MRWYFVSVLLGAAAIGGCVDERRDTEPGPSCESCGKFGGSVGSGGGGGTGGMGETEPGTVTGSVLALTSPSFKQGVIFDGDASVIALSDLIDGTSVSYGGLNGTTFELNEIPGGEFWLFVKDESNGVNDVLSTFSRQISPSTSAQAPIMTRELLTAIGQTLLPSQNLNPSMAQLVLELRRDDAPFVGVSLAEPTYDGIVAYDNGPEGYDTGALATDVFGRILVMNMDIGSRSEITLSVRDEDGVFYPMDVVVEPGAATIAGFTFP